MAPFDPSAGSPATPTPGQAGQASTRAGSFDGFPSGSRSVPVPAPLLGSLLAEIDDGAELRCTLRFFWHLAQRRGFGRAVPAPVLLTDEVLLRALGSTDAVRRALDAAVARGTLLAAADAAGERTYLANDPDGRRAARAMAPDVGERGSSAEATAPAERPNVFELYETNIGMLTPMLAEQLRDAEATYPEEWIEAAMREAVDNNARTWRYVARVLERWAKQGRGGMEGRGGGTEGRGIGADGKPGGHPQALTAAEYRRRSG